MAISDMRRLRLANQRIARSPFDRPGDVVRWLGAVQAQDYAGALWAVGLRMRDATEKTVEGAIDDKTVVRLWFMRGTLHFLSGADARWMLELMAPRMRKLIANVSGYNKLELDEAVLTKAGAVIARALEGGKQLTRAEIAAALERAGIPASGMRLSLIAQRAQADALICYGTRHGKQATFALLGEWLPEAKTMERDAALAEFARRYFSSHGPATVQDFAWWAGLTAGEARAGLEMIKTELVQESTDGQVYWLSADMPPAQQGPHTAYLLPNYDEYTVGYRDRSAILDAPQVSEGGLSNNSLVLGNVIILDGRVVGTWRRTLTRSSVTGETISFAPPGKAAARAVNAAAQRYAAFLQRTLTVGP